MRCNCISNVINEIMESVDQNQACPTSFAYRVSFEDGAMFNDEESLDMDFRTFSTVKVWMRSRKGRPIIHHVKHKYCPFCGKPEKTGAAEGEK